MTLDEVLGKLDGVKGSGAQYCARCPAHEDKHQSLSISVGQDGRILLNCHAGCTTEEIISAMGLSMKELFKEEQPNKKARVVAFYNYTDVDGNLLAQKLRKEDKSFSWRTPDESGGWKYSRSGVLVPLYRLPAVSAFDRVYIVEGEKDADTLTQAGKAATTGADGAGKGKWRKHYTEALKGKDVAIIQDNDTIGKSYALEVATALYGTVASVRVLDLTKIWAELPEHGDATDLFQHMGQAEGAKAIEALWEATPIWEPKAEKNNTLALSTFSASELQNADLPPVVFIVRNMISAGLALLASPPKYGKSWMVLDLCLSVAAGIPFLTHGTGKCGCLYLALEDSKRRLQDRMNKVLQGAHAPQCFDYATSSLDLDNGLIDQLELYITQNPSVKLIVIDTLQKVRGSANSRESAYSADYKAMSSFKEFADRNELCILLVHHLRKMGDDGDPFNRISGTNGILGAADTAMVLTREKREDADTILSVVGRDIESSETVIRFNKDTFQWDVVGDSAMIAEQRAREEYDRNPIVKTIKKLLEQSPGGWSGTASDLMEAGKYTEKTYLAENARALSNRLKQLDKPLFDYDDIVHSRAKHGNAGGRHNFYFSTVHSLDYITGNVVLEQGKILPFSTV